MSELQRLMDRCSGEVTVTCNEHRTYYQTVPEWLAERYADRVEAYPEEAAACIKAGTVAEVQAYPDTPIGFYVAIAPTVDDAVATIHRLIDEREAQP